MESAISHTLHQKRSLNTAEYLSEMDLLNVEYALAKAKQASVRFTFTKKCRMCHKPIADKVRDKFNGDFCGVSQWGGMSPALCEEGEEFDLSGHGAGFREDIQKLIG